MIQLQFSFYLISYYLLHFAIYQNYPFFVALFPQAINQGQFLPKPQQEAIIRGQ
jgi:hypothetical protein